MPLVTGQERQARRPVLPTWDYTRALLFSFLEGSCIPEDLAGTCASLDMPAMALLDRNGVYGSPRFHMAAKKAGVRAHIGSEMHLH